MTIEAETWFGKFRVRRRPFKPGDAIRFKLREGLVAFHRDVKANLVPAQVEVLSDDRIEQSSSFRHGGIEWVDPSTHLSKVFTGEEINHTPCIRSRIPGVHTHLVWESSS